MDTMAAASEEFISAFNALDMGRFLKCLSPGVSLYPPTIFGAQIIEGVAAVEEHFRHVFASENPGGPNILPTEVRIRQFGEAAGLVTFRFAREAGSAGKRSIVFERDDSAWKVAHIHATNTQGT